jgi:hypothetical protein
MTTEPTVILAANRFIARRTTEAWARAVADMHRLHCPEMKMLPFVAMRKDASPCENAINYWCDEPTHHSGVDHKRGRLYAQLTVKAIQSSVSKANGSRSAAPHYLERIFAAIVDDAIERRRRGGKHSRTNITSTVDGFLRELSHYICGQEDHLPPATA